ncbi:MAG: GTP-binding protein [Candidatus Lokiarchaeota archaeon]|nr:GTP-binding protein [Candidatus Lokiarchaeota archaeon]MBD3338289.1 GTP-binding protein [Candidatus Lokiarchaeota archaeon]
MENSDKIVDEINIKLLILGEGGVGKTSIVNSFLGKPVPERYIPTIGSTILRKEYKIKNQDIFVRLNIWDVGGQRSFNPINPSFYNNVDAAFLLFDLTKPKDTLTEIRKIYLENLEKYAKDCLSIVIGNKIDLIPNRENVKKIIKDHFTVNVPLLLTSAKENENVFEAFEVLIYSFLQEWEDKFGSMGFEAISQEFLKTIDKSEELLNGKFINIQSIDKVSLKASPSSHLSKKKVTKTVNENEIGLDKYYRVQKELKQREAIKEEIINSFYANLSLVENLLTDLKNTPINSLIESIDNAKTQLDAIKDDFVLNLDSLMSTKASDGFSEKDEKKLVSDGSINPEKEENILGD